MLNLHGNVNVAVAVVDVGVDVEERYSKEELILFVLLLEFNVLVNILFKWFERIWFGWMAAYVMFLFKKFLSLNL